MDNKGSPSSPTMVTDGSPVTSTGNKLYVSISPQSGNVNCIWKAQ